METFAKISCICGALILLYCLAHDRTIVQDRVLEPDSLAQDVVNIDTSSVYSDSTTVPEPKLKPKPLRERVVDTFTGELGVREEGGENRGERIGKYLATTGLDEGYAWCAAFLSWGFDQHKVENPNSAWTPAWFPDSALLYQRGSKNHTSKRWEPGDVTGIYFQSKGRIAHVGAIERVTDDMVISIEGNTNSGGHREGDGVYRKRRYKRQIYAVSSFFQ